MDFDDLHPQDDYSHRFFIWHEWIQANGPLTADNVFDYFATSMFYDKQSNNQVLRMQTIHTGQPILNEAEELKRFTGIEFALVHAQPPSLFTIHKRERLSPDEVRPLAAYFIINNRIYQSPDVYTIVSNRLLTTLHSLQTSLDILRSHRPNFTPRNGFAWPILSDKPTEQTDKKRTTEEINEDLNHAKDDEARVAQLNTSIGSTEQHDSKKQQNFLPLFNAMRTTAAHSVTSFTRRSTDLLASAAIPSSDSGATAQDGVDTRSSATPAPTNEASRASAISEAAAKGPPGGGKKKRKRTLNAPSTST